jgi:hypothetical protein
MNIADRGFVQKLYFKNFGFSAKSDRLLGKYSTIQVRRGAKVD